MLVALAAALMQAPSALRSAPFSKRLKIEALLTWEVSWLGSLFLLQVGPYYCLPSSWTLFSFETVEWSATLLLLLGLPISGNTMGYRFQY